MSINRGMRKNNGDFIRRIIITTAIGVLVILATLIYNQNNKIKQLETDLYLKQQVQERKDNYSISMLNKKIIQENLNELKSYSILKNSKISQTTTYVYEDDFGFLGLKKRATLKGSANLVYNYDVSFADATIEMLDEGRTLRVTISEPYLDVESVHMEKDTLMVYEDKYNILCNEHDGQKVMKYFNDTFVENGIENIKKLYNNFDKKEELRKIAISEVQELIKTFDLNDCTVVVKLR